MDSMLESPFYGECMPNFRITARIGMNDQQGGCQVLLNSSIKAVDKPKKIYIISTFKSL